MKKHSNKILHAKWEQIHVVRFQFHTKLKKLIFFQELSETAISTYKHIGRIRSARLVGIDLAKFYLQLGQVTILVHSWKEIVDKWRHAIFDPFVMLFSNKADDCHKNTWPLP